MKFVSVDTLKLDFSSLEGTFCYCSAESARRIREKLSLFPLRALHLLGSGDYHYVSLFFLERVKVPFELLLFDNHPDDQPAAFGEDLLSCGSWVRNARRLRMLKASCHIRHAGELDLATDNALPVYLSIDIDVLSEKYARTGWNQGDMSPDELFASLSSIAASRDILGVDLCGGLSGTQAGTDADRAKNARVYRQVEEFFRPL